MKLSEFLKKLGVSLDAEIDEATSETLNVNSNSDKDNDVNNNEQQNNDSNETDKNTKETVNDTKETVEDNKDTQEDIKVELKFDENTGLFDLKGIEDEGIKAVLKKANDYTVRTANNVKIEKAFNEKMGGLKIRKGITTEVIKKMINFDNVKVDGEKVIGLDEAFETLQKEQSGLFVTRQQSESNPMLEGFNPVQNNENNNSGLEASLASLAASLGGSNNI